MKFNQQNLDELNALLVDYPIVVKMQNGLSVDDNVSTAEIVLKNTKGLRSYTFSPNEELEDIICNYFSNKEILIMWNNTHTIFWAIGSKIDD